MIVKSTFLYRIERRIDMPCPPENNVIWTMEVGRSHLKLKSRSLNYYGIELHCQL